MNILVADFFTLKGVSNLRRGQSTALAFVNALAGRNEAGNVFLLTEREAAIVAKWNLAPNWKLTPPDASIPFDLLMLHHNDEDKVQRDIQKYTMHHVIRYTGDFRFDVERERGEDWIHQGITHSHPLSEQKASAIVAWIAGGAQEEERPPILGGVTGRDLSLAVLDALWTFGIFWEVERSKEAVQAKLHQWDAEESERLDGFKQAILQTVVSVESAHNITTLLDSGAFQI